MNWANYTLIIWYVLALGMSMGEHGQEKKEKENFWITLIAFSLMFFLLYIGGWFK